MNPRKKKDWSRAQFSLWLWRHSFRWLMTPDFPTFADLATGAKYPGVVKPNGRVHRGRTIEQLEKLRWLDDYKRARRYK